MRNKLLCHTTALALSLLLTCMAHGQLQKIYLNPKAAGGESQSKIIDSIHFIPLETSEKIHFADYDYAQPAGRFFLLNNYANKEILIYTKEGKFLKRIRYKKLGNELYPSYREEEEKIVFWGSNKNYSLTQKDRIKIELDRNNPKNKKYFKKYIIDLRDKNLAIKKSTPYQYEIDGLTHYYDQYFCKGNISSTPLHKDSIGYEFKIYKNGQIIKSFFPYNHNKEPKYLFTQEYLYPHNTDTPYIVFLTRPYCDTIYKLVKDSIFPAYQLVLPLENTLPASFSTQPFKNKTERDNFNRNNGWMLHQLYNFYETPHFITFLIAYLYNYESYIYDRKTKIIYKTKNIKADSSQYNLPLLSDAGLIREKSIYYKLMNAGDLIPFFKQNKTIRVPKELDAYLKGNPDTNAPVIVTFQLKN